MLEDVDIRSFFDISITHFPDRSARWLLQYIEYIQGLLEIVAPNAFVDCIDFSQLTQLNRSLIADTLREQEADLLFSVPYKRGTEIDDLLIYILIEHQSRVDVSMGLRVMSYMIDIWTAQRREWVSQALPERAWRLRPILPIVFYSGDRPWNTPLTLDTLMDIPRDLSQFVPKCDILFLDVKRAPVSELTRTDHPFGWLLTVLQKEHASKEALVNALIEAMSHLNALETEQSGQWWRAIKYMLLLILHRRPAEEHHELIELVSQHTYESEVETMAKSMADVLREQGIEQGITQGIEQGITQGIEQGITQGETRAKQTAVLKLLQFRFNDVPESVANQITSIQNISRLDALFEEAWKAHTLDEIDWQNLNN